MSGGALYSQIIPLSGLNSLTSRRVINKQNLLTFQWGYHTNRLWAPSKSSTTQVYIISCVVFVVSRYTKNTSARKFVLQNQPVISRLEIFMIVSTPRISWKKNQLREFLKKKSKQTPCGFQARDHLSNTRMYVLGKRDLIKFYSNVQNSLSLNFCLFEI